MLADPKILHIITGLNTGGAEHMLARLALVLNEQGFTSEVISMLEPGAVSSRLTTGGVSVRSLRMRQSVPSARAAFLLSRLAKRSRPEVLQGWMYHGNLAASWAAMSLGRTPLIWNIRHSVHDLSLEGKLSQIVIRLGALLSNRPAAIIYNSYTSARQHESLGYNSARTVVIPNGFDCDRFSPRPDARPRLRAGLAIADHNSVLIGMVARNHPMKDVTNLLAAVGILRAAGADVRLAVIGRGFAPSDPIAQEITKLELGPVVHLLGERDDVHELMPGLDIVAVPSAWGEAFPNVLGEALAAGVPCVATDVGDSRLIVGEHGLVVPPQDSHALAAALRELIAIGPEGRGRLGKGGRMRVCAEFDLRAIARRYRDLYSRCCRPVSKWLPK